MRLARDDERSAVQFPIYLPIDFHKPSAVTLLTIFSPSAITVPRCLNANMVPPRQASKPSVLGAWAQLRIVDGDYSLQVLKRPNDPPAWGRSLLGNRRQPAQLFVNGFALGDDLIERSGPAIP